MVTFSPFPDLWNKAVFVFDFFCFVTNKDGAWRQRFIVPFRLYSPLYLVAMVKISRIKWKQNKSSIKVNFTDIAQRKKLPILMMVLVDGFN